MFRKTLTLADYRNAADAVEAHAPGSVPAPFYGILGRFDAIAQRDLDAHGALADAVIAGAEEDVLEALHDAALLHDAQGPVQVASVRNRLEATILPVLRRHAKDAAVEAWRTIVDEFERIAEELAETFEKVDVHATAHEVARMTPAQQKRWLSVGTLSARLDELAAGLVAARTLHGDVNAGTVETLAGAVLDTTTAHRGRVREALATPGDVSRWVRVLEEGAVFDVTPEVAEVSTMPAPAEDYVEQERRGAGIAQRLVDGEAERVAEARRARV